MPVVDPAISCCPICRPLDCSAVFCPALTCPVGWHAEPATAGECCGTCAQGSTSATCTKAQAAYQELRQELLAKYGTFPCKTDGECQLVVEDNACESNCGEALSTTTAGDLTSNIQSDATVCDSVCQPLARPPCPRLVAVCSNGVCAAVPASGP